MNYYLVCPIGVIGGKQDLLTYSSQVPLQIGAVVEIPFGNKTKQGIVMETSTKPSFATKPINSLLEEQVPEHLLKLATWISQYYAARLSIVL